MRPWSGTHLTCKPSISWFSHHANARYSCAGEYADACKVRFERAVIEMKKKSTRWYAFAFLVITIVVMLVIGFYQSIMHRGPQSNSGRNHANSSLLMQARSGRAAGRLVLFTIPLLDVVSSFRALPNLLITTSVY
jgi:hypothetical protein